MLKVLKFVLLALGVVFVAATIVLMVWDVIQVNQLVTLANANQSDQAALNPNPRLWIILAAGAALVGGLALGLGAGMPRRTFKQRVAEQEARVLAPTTGASGLAQPDVTGRVSGDDQGTNGQGANGQGANYQVSGAQGLNNQASSVQLLSDQTLGDQGPSFPAAGGLPYGGSPFAQVTPAPDAWGPEASFASGEVPVVAENPYAPAENPYAPPVDLDEAPTIEATAVPVDSPYSDGAFFDPVNPPIDPVNPPTDPSA